MAKTAVFRGILYPVDGWGFAAVSDPHPNERRGSSV